MATEMDFPDPYPLLLDADLSIEEMQRLGPKDCFNKLAEKVRQTHEQVNFVAVGAHQTLESLVHENPHLAQIREYQDLQAQVKRCSAESEDFYDQILRMCKSADMDISHAFTNGTFRTTAIHRDYSYAGKSAAQVNDDKAVATKRTRRTRKEMAELRAKGLAPAIRKRPSDSSPVELQIESYGTEIPGEEILQTTTESSRKARLVPLAPRSSSPVESETSDEAPHITILGSQDPLQRNHIAEATVENVPFAKKRKFQAVSQTTVPDSQSQLEQTNQKQADVVMSEASSSTSDSESDDAQISFHSASEPAMAQPATPDRRSSTTSSLPTHETPPPPSGIVSSPATLARRAEQLQQAMFKPSTQDSTYAVSLPSRSPSPLPTASRITPSQALIKGEPSDEDDSDTEDEASEEEDNDFADNPMFAHLNEPEVSQQTPSFAQLDAADTDASDEDSAADALPGMADDETSPSPQKIVTPQTPDGSFHPNQAQAAQQESRRSRTSSVRRIDFGADDAVDDADGERAFIERLQGPERSFSPTQPSILPSGSADGEGEGGQEAMTAAAKRRADRSARKKLKGEARPPVTSKTRRVGRPRERSGPALTQPSPTPVHRITRSRSRSPKKKIY